MCIRDRIRAARKLRGRIDAGVQVTLEQLEAAKAAALPPAGGEAE